MSSNCSCRPCGHSSGSFLCPHAAEAARRLDAGGLIIYPTETFFGLGCRADNAEAVLRVFAAKQRRADMPLPVIIGNAQQAACVVAPHVLARPGSTQCAEAAPARTEAPGLAEDFADLAAFWPGPLTLLLPVRPGLPKALTGGTGRIALRVSPHPAARALALACGFPIVSSSANISGRPPVTQAAELDPELIAALRPGTDGIFDLPPAPGGGQASTIAEPLGGRRLILRREGALSAASLARAGFSIIRP